jgi:hypothetical protein
MVRDVRCNVSVFYVDCMQLGELKSFYLSWVVTEAKSALSLAYLASRLAIEARRLSYVVSA